MTTMGYVTVQDDGLDAARAWDVEYEAGRYRDEPPLPFVADVLAAAREQDQLFAGYAPVLAPRLERTWRAPPARGQWSQWEAIWRRPVQE
jgi:hypothetical protein